MIIGMSLVNRSTIETKTNKDMNKISKLMTVVLAVVISSYSMNLEAKSDKTVDKARSAVENASPDDWQTYAKSAQMLIRKKANMAEAKMWIEKSIEIRETPFNLEIMGDYYVKNNLPKQAIKFYIKSMDKLKENDANIDTAEIQDKIVKATTMR